jgi:hypothetical protein
VTARAAVVVAGPVDEVEALLYEPALWPSWVDGFAHLAGLEGPWPDPGAVLEWNARPGGRGRVRERVTERLPGTGQVLDVEDERLWGTQRLGLAPRGDRVHVSITLEYNLKERNALTPLVDALFVRRSLSASLRRSLTRFARERAAAADLR